MLDVRQYGNAAAYYWTSGGVGSPGNVGLGAGQTLPAGWLSGTWPVESTASNIGRRAVFVYTNEAFSPARFTTAPASSAIARLIVGRWGKNCAVFPFVMTNGVSTWQLFGRPANAV